MKAGAWVNNTNREALIYSELVIKALKTGKIGYPGLDVYEQERDLFIEDFSNSSTMLKQNADFN
jgi:D-lactate dehydrogenase